MAGFDKKDKTTVKACRTKHHTVTVTVKLSTTVKP